MSDKYVELNPETARRLADALLRRRIEVGIRSARALGLQSGLDYRTITSLEAARRDQVSRTTLAVLEHTLQLPVGWLMALCTNEAFRRYAQLEVPADASDEAVDRARRVAQQTFNEAIRMMQ